MAATESGFFRNVLEASPSPVVVFERRADGYFILYVNRAFERRTGYTAAVIGDCDWQLLCGRDSDAGELQRLRAEIDRGEETRAVLRVQCRDGSEFWSELHAAPLLSQDDGSRQSVIILRDITAERAERQLLEHRALYDALTGLPNRYLFQDRLEHAIDHARSRNGTFALVCVDLDNFKHVNDTRGHAAGDELLRQVAARLSGTLRAGDTVARVGGDEFILLLDSVHERGPLTHLLHRLAEGLEQPALLAGEPVDIRCSLGASRFPLDGTDARSLLGEADRAMYRNKAGRRQQIPFQTDAAPPEPNAKTCQPAAAACSH